ncbi:hypothetical protein [Mesorhizobium sp.]|uniref:hypothetical protein n=1 Tax=Mesorhizobium sp. TaxID=1871066 RepID=UPI000FE4A235|nr:hypothetical protein [Mesorhizobium sp.]RWE37453.1 MAG: hypothetical protein EOS77_02415 [Mesorhizobium sp.]
MEEEIRMTRSQVKEIFERWNAAAIEGQWPQKYDADEQTETFLATARAIREEREQGLLPR